jgi:hypothetical protein
MVNEMGRPKGQALREMGRVVWREFKGSRGSVEGD